MKTLLRLLGATKKDIEDLRTAASMARAYAREHGWRETVLEFIAPEDGR